MLNILSPVSYFPVSGFFPFKLKFNLRVLKILLFILLGILLISYIFQVNSVIQETYLLKNYQRELSTLSEDNKSLGISVSQANALVNVESQIKDLNYEKVGEINYIQLVEPQVVVK